MLLIGLAGIGQRLVRRRQDIRLWRWCLIGSGRSGRWRRRNDSTGLQLLQCPIQRLFQRWIAPALIHSLQFGGEIIVADGSLGPGCQIGKGLHVGVFVSLHLHQTATLEVEMNQSKALGVTQYQTQNLALCANGRDIDRQTRQWTGLLHIVPLPIVHMLGPGNRLKQRPIACALVTILARSLHGRHRRRAVMRCSRQATDTTICLIRRHRMAIYAGVLPHSWPR